MVVEPEDGVEPSYHSQAKKHPNWHEAMDAEFNALLQNKTWWLVPPTPRMNIIGCKWVYQIKKKSNGSVERYKARLVTKSFNQVPGDDYFETYSPVMKPVTVRILLSHALS